ncbi:hypothetical protein [Salipaludibacillus sp. CF4.18]|uniref:hypothetical protein n=1 Tax=Salipaludibacillus sp. CF4.18 TaxID=3373081 RepID=UPI003EE44094
MEGPLHKYFKQQSLYWLKNKMTDLCANEVKLYARRKKLKADALGINFKRKESRIIEVKISREDFLRDEVLAASYGYHAIADYAYLMTPVGLLSKEEIPIGYGLLEMDEFDTIKVRRNPTRNPKPILKLDTLVKRTARAATNAVLFQELTKENKDLTDGAFSKEALAHLVRATCPLCKKRKMYLIHSNQEFVVCESRTCKNDIPLLKARVHTMTSYNENFLNELEDLIRNKMT